MRKLSIFLAFILVVTCGLANVFAGPLETSVDNITNSYDGGTKLIAGFVHHAGIRVNGTGLILGSRYNATGTMLIYSPGDAAEWNYTSGTLTPAWLHEDLDWSTEVYIHFHKVSGSGIWDFYGYMQGGIPRPDDKGNDSVAITFGGATTWGGLTSTFNEVAFDIEFQTRSEDLGDTLCIDSVSQGLGGGSSWKWAALTSYDEAGLDPHPDVFAAWNGPYCYEINIPPNDPPELINPPTSYSFSHCAEGSIDFLADDTENDVPYRWELVGPGVLTSTSDTTATWTWSGQEVPQCSDNTVIEVRACDLFNCGTVAAVVNITITNEAPVFDPDGPLGPAPASTGAHKAQYYSASDACNDALTYTIINDGGVVGSVTADADSIWLVAAEADAGPLSMLVEVRDGDLQGCGLADTIQVDWLVSVGAPYRVKIEKEHGPDDVGALQGHLVNLSVDLEAFDATPEGLLGGFDFLIAYDASALSFQNAVAGNVINEEGCNWEYFQYRFGATGNCGGGCPSGLVRVVALAELNNGPSHPDCFVEGTGTLFDLVFLVSNNRTFECSFAPVRFFWLNCGDNTLSNWDGSRLIVNAQVWDYVGAGGYITEDYIQINGADAYPTYLGHQDDCGGTEKAEAEDAVDLFNGGVDIACANLIDDRGDLNLNGIAYEIADAVMFTNYFIQGLSAFGPLGSMQVEASIAASDANADGLPLSVADLVYLIRVIIGDAQAYPKLNPTHATFSHEDNVVAVSAEMGAAFIVVEGQVTPTLLAENMEMKFGYADGNTRILVYNSEVAGSSFNGQFLRTEGEIVSVSFATYEGQPVEARNVPRTFSVEQNYPNPFNPKTTISFATPFAGDWTVSIYNVTGQLVNEINGNTDGGVVDVEWDASEFASGIYFYKVVSGDQTQTKKMVLLK